LESPSQASKRRPDVAGHSKNRERSCNTKQNLSCLRSPAMEDVAARQRLLVPARAGQHRERTYTPGYAERSTLPCRMLGEHPAAQGRFVQR
jgi:hypothetical protein